MRITAVEPISLGRTVLVRLDTDEGVSGWGECSPMNADVVLAHVRDSLAPLVVGTDPFDVEALVERVLVRTYKIAGQTQAMALSGIEIACWDVMGRALGQPVYRLLGGAYRERVAVYGSSMRRDIAPEAEAERLVALRERHGYQAFKIRVGSPYGFDVDAAPGRSRAVVAACRKALGDDVDLLVDGNSCFTPAQAIRLGRFLEGHGVWHFEEPCPYFDLEATAKVAAALDMPVAGGEQDWDLHRFRDMLVMGAVDIVQPDVIKVGGFLMSRKVAALAQAFSVPVTVHNAQPNLGTVATLHFAAATPGCRYPQEMSIEEHVHGGRLWAEPLEVRDGAIAVPDGPGLGVTMDTDYIDAHRVDR